MKHDLTAAILSLCPGGSWTLKGNDYSGLEWNCPMPEKPTEAELLAEIARLDEAWERTNYQRLRAAEYPPMADYLDAVVKDDRTAIQQYIDACLGVKAKYPKPASN